MKKNNETSKINLKYIIYKTEELLKNTSNRYDLTIQVSSRAKKRKYEDIDIIDDPINKPIIKAILEMIDEITETKILKH
uniref:Putative DNA-directed RNA polymerase subunit omega n=1 Tax=Caloglossa intermedia TaxID=100879 RepID=A0A1Z1M646_9FLOR|nr:putative DNA-directed RNA polymerase subunit omega [Caloglossa intermedia]ARW61400.1 putative DNA-directed RNA polymerase subunit omega [Caloglossa intermedia]